MKKFFYMNSLFTKVILAVLTFAVIICIFIPYMRIPAVDPVQDIDVAGKTLDRKIGADQLTFSITEFVHSTSPVFELYKDKELTETVNKSAIPLLSKENTYYFATYAYGYDKADKKEGLQSVLLGIYKIVFTKDANCEFVSVQTEIVKSEAEGIDGTIKVVVPNAQEFDLVKIIDSKSAWLKQKSPKPQPIPMSDVKTEDELKNMSIEKGGANIFYAAICFASEADKMYYPLDVYSVFVERDTYKETLPVVGEIGGGILSKTLDDGTIEFYEKDMFMFAFMILAAIATIFALTIPNSFRVIQLVVSSILGLGLMTIPAIDIIFYSVHKFEFDPGCFVLIALGLIIILWAVFDFIRCTVEYRAEQIHLYGDDFFSAERKQRMAEEKKIKDAEYRIQRKADKEALKAFKAEEAAKLAAYKAEQKAKKKK